MSERDEIAFRVLRTIESSPKATQRDIARSVRASLGAVNYCLRALQQKGLVKVQNFRATDAKLRYAYVLTPSGLARKAALTRRFLAHKLVEYETLQAEIAEIEAELNEKTPS
ncbi:MarR family EPS-associated transcriptional regulator [Rhodobacteraceae bacterium MCCB 386]|nr:MarR family EPS-associated transcriptional regulator [Roseitranquillus sediminis]